MFDAPLNGGRSRALLAIDGACGSLCPVVSVVRLGELSQRGDARVRPTDMQGVGGMGAQAVACGIVPTLVPKRGDTPVGDNQFQRLGNYTSRSQG
jgi:hypothetical protein